ncbi:class I SAM-dependent methyltransferase [Glutamicibacter sp.]|jgi:Methylase involved in ubiquinone/menaquinone biosynthesis|uniref:class I SAM-dependent methyltransferase n=1 Tax=Glutamicibacter sp. TaxID=1931995 RepID=UPI002B47DDBD|nr:class I SAM-dependent methyltransferase [Glutamicibacter sp.]HJX78746.1 class I SAM-dependent methyltransferase [Glutamicibacter sp.]
MNQTNCPPTVSSHSAVLHDEVRPAWSAEVISWLLGSPSRGHRLAVLDLGAGTGLGTRTIAALGCTVTAVDTSKDMLSVLRTACEDLPPDVADRISIASGSAEHLPLGNQSVDAIVCLQAWHWVNPERAIAECDRVMTPNGMMGLAWHTWDRASDWVKALSAIVEPEGPPAEQIRSVPAEFAGRGTFERMDFSFNFELSVDQLVHLASSWAFVTQRSDKEAVLTKIRRLGERTASADTGLVSFPHITAAFRLQQLNKEVVR